MTKRIFYLDVVRALAMTMVILLHSVADYFNRSSAYSISFYFTNTLYTISSIGVILFIFISGAIYLNEDKQISFNKLLRKILKMVIFFATWSLIYSLIFEFFFPLSEGKSLNVSQIFITFGKGFYHLWYVYLIIVLYLLTPLFRLFTKKKYFKIVTLITIGYIFAISIIFLILRNLTTYNFINTQFFEIYDCFYIDIILFLPALYILGWILSKSELKKIHYVIYVLGFISLVGMIIGNVYLKNYGVNSTGYIYTKRDDPLLVICSLSVFLLVKKIFENYQKEGNFSRLITFYSKHSLGIYALHPMFCLFTYYLLDLGNVNNALLYVLIAFIVSLSFSTILTYLFSKIKYVREIV